MDNSIGEKIKQLMKKKPITQLELSVVTKIPQSTISRYTTAQNAADIKPEHLSLIAQALSVSEAEITAGGQNSHTSTNNSVSLLQNGHFEISDAERLENMKRCGLLNVYPDRAEAFRYFQPIWDKEHHIRIVGSSIEGFKRGTGIDAEELLRPKLQESSHGDTHIQIMLTHADFATYREDQEQEQHGYIAKQIKATSDLLKRLKAEKSEGNTIEWKYFRGAPTCFMIIAGDYMLLNPYLYMQPGYFNFSVIVEKTKKSIFDIYRRFELYHFVKAWENKKLCVEDSGC
jgi:transcriptional regulator with XRE-family HTH domain